MESLILVGAVAFVGGLVFGVVFSYRILKANFSALSSELLNKSADELSRRSQQAASTERELAVKDLDGKKELIDAQLSSLNDQLKSVSHLVHSMEKERGDQLGRLASQIGQTNEQTASLLKLTQSLERTLSNSQMRGQWGERIAEDILRLAGFVENINYRKQVSLESGVRPDFTFILPSDLTLNMDVKFPITNFSKYLDAEAEGEKDGFKKAFLRDMKLKIKEVSDRGYVATKEKTVEFAILFVPNEQVFSFVQSEAPELFEDAIRRQVVCCSPLTLFAVLAVVRQAVDNFALERRSGEILECLSGFQLQWKKYVERFDQMGKKLSDAQKEFDALRSTRTNMLDRSLGKIEKLRSVEASEDLG